MSMQEVEEGKRELEELVVNIVKPSDGKEHRKALKEARELRKKRREEFLEVATKVLEAHGIPDPRAEAPYSIVDTPSFPVTQEGETLNIIVRRESEPFSDDPGFSYKQTTTSIIGVLPEGEGERSLFQIHEQGWREPNNIQDSYRFSGLTEITYLGKAATNDQVLKGLNAMKYIQGEMNRQNPQGSTISQA